MLVHRTFLSARHLLASSSFLLAALALQACGDGENHTITLAGDEPLFAGLDYQTGLLPGGAPVQASFAVTAQGAAAVRAQAMPSGSSDSPTLSGLPGGGAIKVGGSFGLTGRLVVDLTGLPSYDGPIPGIENVAINFDATTTYSPFAIDKAIPARAEIPATDLPPIPLPGGIPGKLVLQVAEGSFVEVGLSGSYACIEGEQARYGVSLARGGTLVIAPRIEIDLPLAGTKSFAIPNIEVPLSLGSTNLAMRAELQGFGDQPEQGDHKSGRCDGAGEGGGSGVGGSDGVGGGTPMSCVSAQDCAGLPCVMGHCSAGGGVCESGLTIGDPAIESCLSASCCASMALCTEDYADVDGCNDCISAGGGPRCDAFLACATPCFGEPICNSGLAVEDPALAQCLSENCCAEFNTCTSFGSDVFGCYGCFDSGGGPRCDEAIACLSTCP